MKIGVVGSGEITRKMHLPVLLNMDGVTVSWVFDRDANKARELAAAYKVKSIESAAIADFPQVDVVLLAIPVEFRSEYLTQLAARGIAVMCEKPFALSAAEHAQVLRSFEPGRLGCGYMRRYYHSTRTLAHVLRCRWFGGLRRIVLGEGGRSRTSGVEGSFLDSANLGRSKGVLSDVGSHGLDILLKLLSPVSTQVLSCDMVIDGDVDRRVSASLAMQVSAELPPVMVDFTVSWLDRQTNRIELIFDTATVWCGIGPDAEVYVGEPGSESRSVRLACEFGAARNPNQAFFLEWKAFLAGVADGVESEISAHSALQTTTLVEALHEKGRPARA